MPQTLRRDWDGAERFLAKRSLKRRVLRPLGYGPSRNGCARGFCAEGSINVFRSNLRPLFHVTPVTEDPRIAALPDIHGHAKGEHKPFAEERPIPYTARMLFLWFFHACRRGSPRFLMVADHMNYLTFEDPAAVNLVRRALKLAAAGDLYGAAETPASRSAMRPSFPKACARACVTPSARRSITIRAAGRTHKTSSTR